MLTIKSAIAAYLAGDLDAWDLQEVVEANGGSGFIGNSDGTVTVYKNISVAWNTFNAA